MKAGVRAPAFCFFTERFERYRKLSQPVAFTCLMHDSHIAMSESQPGTGIPLDGL
jgi:hypothetical protein